MSHPALPRALVGLPWRLLLVVAGVGLFGLVVLFSAAGGSLTPWAANQGVRFVVFFAAMIALARVRPERWSAMAFPVYAVILAALIAVEAMGVIGGGSQRWLDLEIGKHTSELQSLMRISYAVFCLKKKIAKQK